MKALVFLGLSVLLSSCGFQPLVQPQLPFDEIEIQTNNWQLEKQAHELFANQLSGNGVTASLQLTETQNRKIIAYNADGEARQIQLTYELKYQLSDEAGTSLHEGDFRYTKTFDNNDTILHATNLRHQRIYAQSRRLGLAKLIRELLLLTQTDHLTQ